MRWQQQVSAATDPGEEALLGRQPQENAAIGCSGMAIAASTAKHFVARVPDRIIASAVVIISGVRPVCGLCALSAALARPFSQSG
jgi:hypothetical protein